MKPQHQGYRYTTYTGNGSIDERFTFGVARLPGRKSPALYLCRDEVMKPLAYFLDSEGAALFAEILSKWKDSSFQIS